MCPFLKRRHTEAYPERNERGTEGPAFSTRGKRSSLRFPAVSVRMKLSVRSGHTNSKTALVSSLQQQYESGLTASDRAHIQARPDSWRPRKNPVKYGLTGNAAGGEGGYPVTLILANDSTALPVVGWPNAVAGRKTVKISILFNCGKQAAISRGPESMR